MSGLVDGDVGPVDLEVVVVLRVELADLVGRPGLLEVLHGLGRRVSSVVPALEGRDQEGDRPARVLRRARSPDPHLSCVVSWTAVQGTASSAYDVEASSTADRLGRSWTPSSARSPSAHALSQRVVVADGAMGTMLQAQDPTMDDFQGLEGCNEVLNVTRPDIVPCRARRVLRGAGVDCVETNTFGANLANLGEYDASDRIRELAEAGARLAREVADDHSTSDRPRWVLGSVGPGHQAPDSGARARSPRCATPTARRSRPWSTAASTRSSSRPPRTSSRPRPRCIGARRAMRDRGGRPRRCSSTSPSRRPARCCWVPRSGLPSQPSSRCGIDLIGLNCATGPAEMSEHLRHLSRHAAYGPVLHAQRRASRCSAPTGRTTRSPRSSSPTPTTSSPASTGCRSWVAAAARRPSTCGWSSSGSWVGRSPSARPRARRGPRRSTCRVPFRQDTSYLSIGERTNANGSRAFRDAMLEERWDTCVEIAREQTRDGAHLLDVCIDYVGRDGVADMREVVGRLATASTLPLVLDSTEPAVLEAGLELLGGRALINSVNYEDGDGPTSRFARIMPLVVEHGAAVVALTIDEEGQARTAEWKVRVAERLIDDLTGTWGHAGRGHPHRLPHASRSPRVRRRRVATLWRPSRRSARSSARTPMCRRRSACPTCRSA